LLREDIEVRKFLTTKLRDAGLASIDIERSTNGVIISIMTSRPGMVIGRGGTGVEQLKKQIARIIGKGKRKVDVKVNIQEVQNPDQNAQVVVGSIIEQIEKRLPFRRIMKHTVDQVMRSGAQGAKVMLSGRLNGAEIARTEKLANGKIPLQTLRADVDYARGAAHTTYGAIGVKVWVYRGEVFASNSKKKE
jgi:small subunit ribosomal protein S3